jgi:hypothetical protein
MMESTGLKYAGCDNSNKQHKVQIGCK